MCYIELWKVMIEEVVENYSESQSFDKNTSTKVSYFMFNTNLKSELNTLTSCINQWTMHVTGKAFEKSILWLRQPLSM